MKTAYFDCFSGISGDMILGSLIDLGLDFDFLKEELKKLNVVFDIQAKKVVKNGITATKFDVITKDEHDHRHLSDINKIIDDSKLDKDVKEASKNIFHNIAVAEAKIHNIDVNNVHFHEIGAVDTIIDVVGAVVGIKKLGIEKVYCSRINVGSGFVKMSHGQYPVPAPATLELLKEKPIYQNNISGELTTPTGAAIIMYFAKSFGIMPEIKVEKTGYGAGFKDLEQPNVLRVILGSEGFFEKDTINVIEANIDNINPEILSYVLEKLMNNNALDAHIINVLMKKGRPGFLLRVLCNIEDTDKLSGIIFDETTTIGVRIHQCERKKLQREIKEVQTRYGNIKVKISGTNIAPEFEDCKTASEKHNVPLKKIYEEVMKFTL